MNRRQTQRKIRGVANKPRWAQEFKTLFLPSLLLEASQHANANAKLSNRAGLSILYLPHVIRNDFQRVHTGESSLHNHAVHDFHTGTYLNITLNYHTFHVLVYFYCCTAVLI